MAFDAAALRFDAARLHFDAAELHFDAAGLGFRGGRLLDPVLNKPVAMPMSTFSLQHPL